MYGRQSSRVFDRRNAFFKPIEDDEMPCSSSSPSSASSPVSFWSSCAEQPGVSEDDMLASLHEEGLHDRVRMKLIGELIVSERDYVKDLETINSFFLQPLRKRRILPDNDVGQLFSTLPAIISLNKALLSAVVGSYTQAEAFNRSIDATVASLVQNKNAGGKAAHFGAIMTARGLISLSSVKRKECLIADAFQQMASYLKVYTTYSTRYVEAVAIIKRNKSANPAFEAFLEEVKGAPECRGRDMKTLMLRPVQRLCQYIAVLDDLVRFTPRTHGDYHLLAQTAAKIQEVARDAEESLLTLQLAAKSEDEAFPYSQHNAPSPSGSGGRGSRGGSSGNGRRRKISLSLDDQPARIERRRDSLADLPDLPEPIPSPTTTITLTITATTSDSSAVNADEAQRPKRQVSWRFMSALSPSMHRSFSVGDCDNSHGSGGSGESLLSLLEKEKGSGSGCSSGRRRSLKRGGSLTSTGAIKAQPRRVNSSASLCRSESATGSTFKGSLVC